jgi:uncharacterized protein YfaP (DUF2135 family)
MTVAVLVMANLKKYCSCILSPNEAASHGNEVNPEGNHTTRQRSFCQPASHSNSSTVNFQILLIGGCMKSLLYSSLKAFFLAIVLFFILALGNLVADTPDVTDTGIVIGQVTDATTGRAIQGVRVSIGEISSTSDVNGAYRLTGVQEGTIRLTINASVTAGVAPLTTQFSGDLREGTQTITAEATGYSTYIYEGLEVVASVETRHNISLSPRLTDAQMRFVLSWGASPSDLDSHLRTPYGTKIFYSYRGSSTAEPYALLDVDDTNGYGPETVTIYRFREGTYHYFIYNYSGSPAITTSNAVVKIYAADGTTRSIDVPTSGTGRYWYVASVDGTTGRVQIINRIQTNEPGLSSKAIVEAEPEKTQIQDTWTYLWEFGDETTSTELNPQHTYTQSGLYTVKLTASKGDVNVIAEQTNYIVVTGSGTGVLYGVVRDATNNQPINGAVVRLGEFQQTTNAQGQYRFENVPEASVQVRIDADTTYGYAAFMVQFESSFRAGFYTIQSTANNYSNFAFEGLQVVAGQQTEYNISMSPILTNADLRFVLTWGASPSDLDSHVRTPSGAHVYYSSRGSMTVAPFVFLDVDDTDGYGPETTTFAQLSPGTYHYYIYQYSSSGSLIASNAQVKLYSRTGAYQTVEVPTSGTGRYWYVATIDGATGRVSIINRIQSDQPGVSSKESVVTTPKSNDALIMSGWSYDWDFGDETGSEEANPSHLYLEPGLYTVTLIARNGDFSATTTRTNLIEVILNTSIEIETPGEFRLVGAYPNPFNPGTTIRYELPEAGMVGFEVHNLIGQQLIRFDETFESSGTHSVRVDATGWSSGVYLYTIKFGGQIKTGKMVLIK